MSLTEDILNEVSIGGALKGLGKGIAKGATKMADKISTHKAKKTLAKNTGKDDPIKTFTIISFDKDRNIADHADIKDLKQAEKFAINKSKNSNTLFVRLFADSFDNVKTQLASNKGTDPESLVCVYKNGKAATDPKYNRIKEFATNIKSDTTSQEILDNENAKEVNKEVKGILKDTEKAKSAQEKETKELEKINKGASKDIDKLYNDIAKTITANGGKLTSIIKTDENGKPAVGKTGKPILDKAKVKEYIKGQADLIKQYNALIGESLEEEIEIEK